MIFWILIRAIDVYKFALSGAIYEILWLPMLVSLFVLPVLSFIRWRKENFKFSSLYFFSILVMTSIALIIYFVF